VQRRQLGGEAGERLEQLERPLARHPVADAEERSPAAGAEIGAAAWRGHRVAAGRNHQDPVGG
jgi:hypothetical protein